MDQASKLKKALYYNATNPQLAWQLFKRVLSSPTAAISPHHFLPAVPLMARVLVAAKMLPELNHLHRLLISQQTVDSLHSSLLYLVRLSAKAGFHDEAISQFKTLRTQFPDKGASVSLYNVLIQSSLKVNKPCRYRIVVV